MNVYPVWCQGYTGRDVVVSILDDGIEKDHPDIKKNYARITRQFIVLIVRCQNAFVEHVTTIHGITLSNLNKFELVSLRKQSGVMLKVYLEILC